MDSVLTPEDRALILAETPDFLRPDQQKHWVLQSMDIAEVSVRAFVCAPYPGGTPPVVGWLHRGLQCVSAGHWNSYSGRNLLTSRTNLLDDFTETLERETKDHNLWYQEDPVGYLRAYPNAVIEDGGVSSHPWGQDVIRRCYRWLSATDYQVWAIAMACQREGILFVKDHVLSLTSEPEPLGGTISEAVRRVFYKAMEPWMK
jgi:hypothetical protein